LLNIAYGNAFVIDRPNKVNNERNGDVKHLNLPSRQRTRRRRSMYVCMYVCMYACRLCTYAHMHVCMYVCMYVCSQMPAIIASLR